MKIIIDDINYVNEFNVYLVFGLFIFISILKIVFFNFLLIGLRIENYILYCFLIGLLRKFRFNCFFRINEIYWYKLFRRMILIYTYVIVFSDIVFLF